MSTHDWNRAPERLIHGKYGPLLRQANRELESGLDQSGAFQRVAERLAASRAGSARSRNPWLVVAPFVAAALAMVLLVSFRMRRADSAPELVAEPWRPLAAPSEPSGPPSLPPARAPALADAGHHAHAESQRELASSRAANARLAAGSARSAGTQLPPPATTQSEKVSDAPTAVRAAGEAGPSVEVAPAPDCLSLARQGDSRGSESCFLERARGGGLAAEMALYELARLRRDVLADANGALQALADYRKRFPNGSLRREVDVSQLELLLQLGRSADALKQSDELLSSSTSGERASELRLLRGHILRKQSRFAEAVREYELAESAGARASEATYFRALCLEASGRTTEAIAALTKYLELPQRPYAKDAKRRLEKLSP